jgi:hypothetical protein
VDRGLESRIREKLNQLRERDQASPLQRYRGTHSGARD